MTVRVGFLGAGLIAHFHALGLFVHRGRGLAGVYDPDRSRADEFATGWGTTICATGAAAFDGCDAVSHRQPDGAFVRSVAEGRQASPTFRDAVRPHRLVDAIYRSAAESGAPVVVT